MNYAISVLVPTNLYGVFFPFWFAIHSKVAFVYSFFLSYALRIRWHLVF